MARKKAKSAIDENTIKELYSNKNYIPPKEIELETINEDSHEEKDSENDFSPAQNKNLSSSSNEDLKAGTTFSATGVGSRVGTRVSSRRTSSISASQIPAKKVDRSSNSEIRKIDNVPYWQENKTKDRKRRSMISKQMNGRKKYRWKGLTEEEEDQMEYMLLNCEKSPLKNLSPRKVSPRKSILAEIKDDSNIVGNASSNSKEDNPQLSSHNESSQENRPCDEIHISDSTNSNLNPDGKSELSSTYDNDSLAQLNIDLCLSLPENISQNLPKPKAPREKNKRRSNSFVPVTNKLIKEENKLIEASIDQVVIGTCQNYCNKTSQPYEAERSDNKENALRLTSTNKTENMIQKSIDDNVMEYSSDFKGFKSDEALTPKKCDSSILHHSGTFLDDSYILKQVNEADKLLGGLLDSTICKSRSASPIFDDLTIKKTARSSMKVHSVRRSSRLFRSKQIVNDSEGNENYRMRGSVFTEVELNIKSRIKK